MTTPTEPPFVPFALPSIGEDEVREVVDSLRSGWITMGPKTAAFERAFEDYVGVSHARSVNSCTAAMHLALLAHGVGPDAEVVVPSLTFAATATVVEHVGARPVFAEVDEGSYALTVQTIAEKLTPRTRAVILVHFAGLPADLEGVTALCRDRDVVLVEDAAHAVGARYRGRPIGSHGTTACFSFYANKTLTTGEGGMVTTPSRELAERIEVLRLHGMSRDAWRRYTAAGNWRYDILEAGYKYNMSDLNAALGLAQLRRLEAMIDRRARIAALYREGLADLSGLRVPAPAGAADRHAWHIFVVRLVREEGAPARDVVIERLVERRIGFSVHFQPLHLMRHYRERWGCKPGDLPGTERIAEEVLSLPMYPDLAADQIARVVAAVREGFGR